MSQSRCLPCRHKDLNLDPQHTIKKSGMEACTCDSSTWEAEIGVSLGPVAGQSSSSMCLGFS